MLVFISSIIFYNLAYTTQEWIGNLKTYALQANICKCTYKCNIQVYELAPPTCVFQILIRSPYNTMSFHLFAPPSSYYLCEFSPPLSTINTKGELKF
jgi:hypothetical protein